MSTRSQNERKFGHWDELPGGGRRYWFEMAGRYGWKARYLKEANAEEVKSIGNNSAIKKN